MLQTLSIRNGFVHQNFNVTFKEGQTAILGKNGKGKSLITEFAQYAIWGTKALRGDAEDYKKLQVSASFDVKDKSYAVHRSGSNVNLIGPDGPLASGTKAVNAAIEKLFGYDYNVFMIANAANQGEIAKLSAMGGSDRKRMVDRTIGLDVIDKLEIFVADQARTLRGRIQGMREAIVVPAAPEPPENYGPTEGLQGKINNMRGQDVLADMLRAKANVEVKWPEDYVSNGQGALLEDYKNLQVAHITDKAVRKSLAEEVARMPPVLEEVPLHPQDALLEALEAIQQRRKELRTGIDYLGGILKGVPRTSQYTDEYLNSVFEGWDLYTKAGARDALRKQLVTYHCPNCNHEWHDEDPRLADFKDIPEVVEKPAIGPKEAHEHDVINRKVRENAKTWETFDKATAEFATLFDHSATIKEIHARRKRQEAYEQGQASRERRDEIMAILHKPAAPDYSERIKDAELDLKNITDYDDAFQKAQLAQHAKDQALEQLKDVPENLKLEIERLQAQLTASTAFDSLMLRYHADFDKFRQQSDAVAELDFELDNWVAARDALKDTRSTIKQHLVPSLNKVASHLINEMTGGELSVIVVDEDFENILVNGIKLHKLSGSGKDVANLALRLGLGMVLTNRTFSSLWLDEIDAGCDDDRAAYISQCLHNLTKTFKQILVISHKPNLVADQRIQL